VPVPTSSAHTVPTGRDPSPPQKEAEPPTALQALPPVMEPPTALQPLPTVMEPRTALQALPTMVEPPTALQALPPVMEPPRDEVTVPCPPPSAPETRGPTRPIAIDDSGPRIRGADESTRPTPMPMPRLRSRATEEADALIHELGMSEEKLARILELARPQRLAEATAELERLLLKPPKLPTPTKAEARELLAALLGKKNGRNGAH
jgi:hypothetical protein